MFCSVTKTSRTTFAKVRDSSGSKNQPPGRMQWLGNATSSSMQNGCWTWCNIAWCRIQLQVLLVWFTSSGWRPNHWARSLLAVRSDRSPFVVIISQTLRVRFTDYSYIGLFVPWTVRTLLDCSYHGLFVPSLDCLYHGLFVPSLNDSYVVPCWERQ